VFVPATLSACISPARFVVDEKRMSKPAVVDVRCEQLTAVRWLGAVTRRLC
jgi:hypothetical protein